MTASAPTWGEIATFLEIDGWRRVGSGERGGSQSDHVFYEKVLADGRLLKTHVSHSSQKRPSPGRFSSILRHQIEITRQEFWQANAKLSEEEARRRALDYYSRPADPPG